MDDILAGNGTRLSGPASAILPGGRRAAAVRATSPAAGSWPRRSTATDVSPRRSAATDLSPRRSAATDLSPRRSAATDLSPRRPALIGLAFLFCLLLLVSLFPSSAAAKPIYFPRSPGGYPGETRDEMDVAPYLSFHQREAMARLKMVETVPTPNQNAWDAIFYGLDLNLVPSTTTISGTVTIRAEVMAGPLSTLQLDFYSNMVTDAATAGGVAATWTHASNILTVNLNRAYATGEMLTVTVQYHGTPTGGYFNFGTWNSQPMIWSLSEPFGARTWWPCKDYPSDKADSVDVRVTVPTTLITASNGTRVLSTDNGTVAVTKWQERYPISTYLVSVASHPYAVSSDIYIPTPGDTMPLQFYVFPDHVTLANPINAMVKNMIAAYAPRFGAYPFLNEKYGHAEFLYGGGMEHQTLTSMGAWIEYVAAHELGHQWWGDLVTCASFHHVWLNEGFATYSEAIWAESKGGLAAYHQDLSFNKYFGAVTIYVADETNEAQVFNSNLSYDKASWVLHMLRHVLGDPTFFAALAAYRAQYAYSVATTENFRDVCEQVSGKDLDRYFQQWIYGEYYPAYRFDFSSTPAGGGYDVTLTLEQTQSWQLFKMPVDVVIATTSGSQTFVVQDSLAAQNFTLHVNAAPTGVAIDPDDWILKTVETVIENPPLDRGTLLVNGVSWIDYGAEIVNAYNAKAFWGNYPIDFWDHFQAPAGGYPSTLPAPLGHGPVPADVIGHYRNVIWVGNNFNGDLSSWYDTPILSYLEAGGNVLLMTRMGDSFLTPQLQNYLGITWAAGSTIYDCIATYAGLTNIARINTQSLCPVFNTTLSLPDSYLLYKADLNYNPDVGIGVYRRPVDGGTYRYNGGRFVFLSGRPYRWSASNLSANVMYILEHFFLEPSDVSGAGEPPPPAARVLFARPSPNPFRSATALSFTLPREQDVDLVVLNVAGREVRKLLSGKLAAGPHELPWDGRDDRGGRVAAGVYWARLKAGETVLTQKVTVVR